MSSQAIQEQHRRDSVCSVCSTLQMPCWKGLSGYPVDCAEALSKQWGMCDIFPCLTAIVPFPCLDTLNEADSRCPAHRFTVPSTDRADRVDSGWTNEGFTCNGDMRPTLSTLAIEGTRELCNLEHFYRQVN